MTVSVVIPAYCAERTIKRAIDSVLAQTSPVHEIIVVDDGSPDQQNEVIEKNYGDRVILIRQSNGKTASARNAGIARATGELVAFLDADDYWEPDKIRVQMAAFRKHAEVGIVASRWRELLPGEDKYFGSSSIPLPFDQVVRAIGADAFRIASMIWTGTVVIRRNTIGELRFTSGMEPAEDRDFWFRILQQQALYYCSENLAVCVLEPNSISRSGIARDCESMLRVVERHRHAIGFRAYREWTSHVYCRWACNERDPRIAFPKLLQSMWLWPLPYFHVPGTSRLGRLKRLVVLAMLAVGLRR